MKRRNFLVEMGGVLACSQLPAWAITTAGQKPVTGIGGRHLDLSCAREITEEFMSIQREHKQIENSIDLHEYSSASVESLEYLASLDADWAWFGFEHISPEMARVLGGWKTYQLSFDGVKKICADAAFYLGGGGRDHLLDFPTPLNIDASCAEGLVRNKSLLSLTLLAVPDLELATVLATHQHELILNLPSSIVSAPVAEALSFHIGYRLDIDMPSKPSRIFLQHLATNPNKQLFLDSHANGSFRVTLEEDIDRWLRNREKSAGSLESDALANRSE